MKSAVPQDSGINGIKVPDSPARAVSRYVLRKKLGSGAMGVVWLAHDPGLDRDVALKILPAEYCKDEERLKRFVREAQLAAKLRHTNTVTIHDVGVSEGEAFIAMELVEGASLDVVVQQGGRLPWREATQAIRDAAAGLAAAHARGLIHRDVKPANLMRTNDGVTKVVDFGLARALASDSRLTQQAARLGTPAYMAPEQWVGKAVDGRSDLYALTCSYYHLLTGRVPFEAPEIAALGYQHRHEPFPEAKDLVPDLPEAVCRILKRGSQKEPAARYQTGEELIADLDAALGEVESRMASPAWQTLRRWQGVARDFAAAVLATGRGFLFRRPIVAAGMLGLVMLLAVVFYVSTNYGRVKIEVEATAGQVEVKVDGDRIDIAGLKEPLRLKVGDHQLQVESVNYRTVTRSFTVRRGEEEVLRVTLEPKASVAEKTSPTERTTEKPAPVEAPKSRPAVYVVAVEPPQAMVSVVGKGVSIEGSGAARTITVTEPNGQATVTVVATLTGYEPSKQEIRPTPGELGRVVLRLKPKPAEFTLSLDPPDAEVSVNGKDAVVTGSGALRTITIAEPDGQSKMLVTAKRNGFKVVVQEVQPKPGDLGKLAFRLERISSALPSPAIAPFPDEKAKEHQAAWAAHLGVPVQITNSIGMKLVLIPAGEFTMGSDKKETDKLLKEWKEWYRHKYKSNPSLYETPDYRNESPEHHVKITSSFFMGIYEAALST
jgi:hypothetical protein